MRGGHAVSNGDSLTILCCTTILGRPRTEQLSGTYAIKDHNVTQCKKLSVIMIRSVPYSATPTTVHVRMAEGLTLGGPTRARGVVKRCLGAAVGQIFKLVGHLGKTWGWGPLWCAGWWLRGFGEG